MVNFYIQLHCHIAYKSLENIDALKRMFTSVSAMLGLGIVEMPSVSSNGETNAAESLLNLCLNVNDAFLPIICLRRTSIKQAEYFLAAQGRQECNKLEPTSTEASTQCMKVGKIVATSIRPYNTRGRNHSAEDFPMETDHNPQITPGTHLQLGGQGLHSEGNVARDV